MKAYFLSTLAFAVIAVDVTAAERGFFAGAGVASLSVDSRGLDDSDLGYQLTAGWQFGPHVAIEGRFVSLGKYSGDGGSQGLAGTIRDAEVRALAGSLRMSWPLTSSLEAFGTAGLLLWDAEWTETVDGVDTTLSQLSVNDDGTDYVWGLGLAYRASAKTSVQLGWDRYKAGDIDVDAVALAVRVRFGRH